MDMGRFDASFKAGWQEWKKKGPHHEESSFEMSMNALNVELDRPVRYDVSRRSVQVRDVLVVKDKIYILVGQTDRSSTALWRYNVDLKSI